MTISSRLILVVTALLISASMGAQDFLDLRMKSTEGGFSTINSEAEEDNLILIDFWATWCKPCVKAIPTINLLNEEFSEKGLAIIGINADSPRNLNKVRPFTKTHNMQYPVLIDSEQKLMNKLLINALPTLILCNKEGEILYRHRGFSPGDEKKIRAEILQHLGE